MSPRQKTAWQKQLKRLSQALSYQFQQPELLQTALTHRSVGVPNNERLEFLGDSLLGYIIADALFQRFPEASEGKLTRLRSNLVKGETLAAIARDLDLGNALRLGAGEMKSGGWRRHSILADALESIIGALYLDGGMASCQSIVLRLFQSRLDSVSIEGVLKDPKTRLQEFLQSHRKDLPIYIELAKSGKDHELHFVVECQVPSVTQSKRKHITRGEGDSRRKAEQIAAAQALENLQQELANKH